jgi:hypothetical protein
LEGRMKRSGSAMKRAFASQASRFREAARMLGCDESEEAFNAALKKVAKAPPPKESKSQPKKSGR